MSESDINFLHYNICLDIIHKTYSSHKNKHIWYVNFKNKQKIYFTSIEQIFDKNIKKISWSLCVKLHDIILSIICSLSSSLDINYSNNLGLFELNFHR